MLSSPFKTLTDESEIEPHDDFFKDSGTKEPRMICSLLICNCGCWFAEGGGLRLWLIIDSCRFQAIINMFASFIHWKLGHPWLETMCYSSWCKMDSGVLHAEHTLDFWKQVCVHISAMYTCTLTPRERPSASNVCPWFDCRPSGSWLKGCMAKVEFMPDHGKSCAYCIWRFKEI